jgi:hypothetical protein
MTDPRWVTAHGKRILIETLETPGMAARKTKYDQKRFMLPLQWMADMAKGAGIRGAMVLVVLHTRPGRLRARLFRYQTCC